MTYKNSKALIILALMQLNKIKLLKKVHFVIDMIQQQFKNILTESNKHILNKAIDALSGGRPGQYRIMLYL